MESQIDTLQGLWEDYVRDVINKIERHHGSVFPDAMLRMLRGTFFAGAVSHSALLSECLVDPASSDRPDSVYLVNGERADAIRKELNRLIQPGRPLERRTPEERTN